MRSIEREKTGNMRKKLLLILLSILMFTLVGCSQTSDTMVGEVINNKYLFETTKDESSKVIDSSKTEMTYSRDDIQRIFDSKKEQNGWDSVSVLADSTEYYNDELCYMVSYSYTKANGMSYANQVFVGNKTLEVYDFSEVYR